MSGTADLTGGGVKLTFSPSDKTTPSPSLAMSLSRCPTLDRGGKTKLMLAPCLIGGENILSAGLGQKRLRGSVGDDDAPLGPRNARAEQDVETIDRLVGRGLVNDQAAHRQAVVIVPSRGDDALLVRRNPQWRDNHRNR